MFGKQSLKDIASWGKEFEYYAKSNGQLQRDFERGQWHNKHDIIFMLIKFFWLGQESMWETEAER